MEQLISQIADQVGGDTEKAKILFEYAKRILETNEKFNLTGYKTLHEVVEGLILDSIKPLKNLSVPRGTRFVDIGTGSGVPGVVLGVLFDGIEGVLVDSNSKKIDFINANCRELGVSSIRAEFSRAEDFSGETGNRGIFDFCVTKAFGPLYYSAEFAAPLVKKGGFLYVYSRLNSAQLSDGLNAHFLDVGFFPAGDSERAERGIASDGLLWIKKSDTPDSYPRRFPVIKRLAEKVPETR